MDIKETKEMLALVKVIVTETCKAVKAEGFQAQDLVAFLQSPEFEPKLQEAVEGVEQIPAEIDDVGILEGVSLAKELAGIVTAAMAALKTPA